MRLSVLHTYFVIAPIYDNAVLNEVFRGIGVQDWESSIVIAYFARVRSCAS